MNLSNNHQYNKNLQPFANKLRKNMTKAEACLWKYVLRAGQLKGYSFRRQRPVLNYIADFMCMELMLVIEVDGITHDWEETVLRFSDGQVLSEISGVINYLEEWIDKKTGE